MNKRRIFVFRYILLYCTALFLSILSPLSAQDIQGQVYDKSDSTAHLWASGNDGGVYLVLPQTHQGKEWYKIFYHDITSDKFLSGFAYSGQPDVVSMYQDRLVVFLQSGGCQSYSMRGDSLTERRLPDGLRLLDCNSDKDTLYALAVAEKAVEIHPVSAIASQPVAGEPNEDASVLDTIQFHSGDYVILERGKDNEWRCVCSAPLPLAESLKQRIVVLGETFHIFGIFPSDSENHTRENQLRYFRVHENGVGPDETILINDVYDLTALQVNRQLRIMVFTSPPSRRDDAGHAQAVTTEVQIGRLVADGWQFSPLPFQDQNYIMNPEQVVFTTFGQNIAFFAWKSEKDVQFGYFSPTPNEKVFEIEMQPISAVGQTVWPLQQWLASPYLVMTCMAIAGFLLYRRRHEVFSSVEPLPDYIVLASLGRRLAAFLLDFFIISLLFFDVLLRIAKAIFPERLSQLNHMQLDTFEQLQQATFDPFILKLFLVFFFFIILYFLVSEVLFFTTPGKLVFRLAIVQQNGKPLTKKQAFLRNIFRIIELHFQMLFPIFLVMLFTRKKQRIGDLAGRTMIVMKTPELKMKREEPENLNDEEKKEDDDFDLEGE
jgi:uncharacterized RDD family membrane protein YckC